MSADPSEPKDQADELDPDEPRTPLWLPLLGLVLFLSALIYFLVGGDDTQSPNVAAPAALQDSGAPAAPEE